MFNPARFGTTINLVVEGYVLDLEVCSTWRWIRTIRWVTMVWFGSDGVILNDEMAGITCANVAALPER